MTPGRDPDLLTVLVAERGRTHQPVTESLLETAAGGLGPDGVADPVPSAASELLQRTAPWTLELGPALVAAIESVAKDTDLVVFGQAELGTGERPSLRSIAAQLGVTNDKVRRSRDRVAARLRSHAAGAPVPLGWAVRYTARQLGAAAPVGSAAQVAVSVGLQPGSGTAGPATRRTARKGRSPGSVEPLELLLWLAGPYRLDQRAPGWLLRERTSDPDDLVDLTEIFLRADGGVHALNEVRAILGPAGISDDRLDAWTNVSGAAVVDRAATAWMGGQLATAVELLFEAAGRPLAASECETLVCSAGRPVTAAEIAVVLRSRRFRPAKSGKYELKSWPPSTGTSTRRSVSGPGRAAPSAASLAAAERRRPAGAATAPAGHRQVPVPSSEQFEQSLFERLGIAGESEGDQGTDGWASSSRAGRASWQALTREGDPPSRPTGDEAEADRVWFAVEVDADTFSGSPGVAPELLIRALGIGWHQRRTFASRYGPVTLSNDASEPSHSALRPLALGAGADEGDRMELGFGTGGDLVVKVVKSSAGLRS